MAVFQSDRRKLVAALNKLGVSAGVANDFLTGLDKGRNSLLEKSQHAIALALVKKFPRKYGWANEEDLKNAVLVEARTGQIIFGHRSIDDKIVLGKTVFIRTVPIISSILAKPHFERFENRVPHMYRDSVGKVTVGIGHLVIDLTDAQSLPFVRRGTNVRATLSEIANDHASVSAQPANQHFSKYEPHTKLDLPQSEIDRLYERDFQIHLAIAKSFFPLHRLPRTAQLGVVDLAHQTGGNNIKDFVLFKAALFRRDWARAGAEAAVNHPVVTKDRNGGRLDLFMSLTNRELFYLVGPNAQRGLRLISVLLKL